MGDPKRKRVTMKLVTPNPLFERWIIEWRDKAKKENSKMQYCLNIALDSLKKYPVPLEKGRDCKILKGFGDKLCQMLDNKLKEHRTGKSDINETIVGNQQLYEDVREHKKKKVKTKPTSNVSPNNKRSKEYLPAEGSGGYAILMTLYTESLDPTYPGFLTKQQITERGQELSHTSFTKPDPGSRYTAWSSMKTLITKNLVLKKSNPAQFSLSEEGILMGQKLFEKKMGTNSSSDTVSSEQSQNSFREVVNAESEVICIDLSDDEAQSTLTYTSKVLEACPKKFPQDFLCFINPDAIKDDKVNTVWKDSCSESNQPSSSVVLLPKSKETSVSAKSKVKTFEKHASTSSVSSSTHSSMQECFIFPPNSFDIILYVDTCETSGSKTIIQDEPILAELQSLEIKYEVKKLKIGDYVWICRDKTSDKELVLPYIVERKRLDDFGSSIKDGRYYEQKFRLKRSGIPNITYLIEKYGNNQYVGLPVTTLHQAATNTALQDGFCVTFTQNIRETARYLANFTRILIKMFQAKTLVSCPKDNLSKISLGDDLISIMTFKEFNTTSTKNKPMKVSDLFVKMLVQIKGMSVDRALAIVEAYPTPALLKQAYESKAGDEAEKLLASIEFGECNKRIGPVLSRIVHKLFISQSLT